jgi:tetratricopeptide (TPR) repeat protein
VTDYRTNAGEGGDDRLVDLVLGLLTPDEEKETLEAVAANGEAESDLVELVAIRESARGSGASGSAAPAKRPSRRALLRRLRYSYLLAASVALFVLVRLFSTGGGPSIAPLEVPSEANRLRGPEVRGGDLGRGLAAYRAGEYEEAARLLAEAGAFGAADTMRLVYLGSALNQTGRYDEAIAVLEELPLETIPDPWGAEGARNLAYALRETGRGEQADSLLRSFGTLDEPGEPGGGAGR